MRLWACASQLLFQKKKKNSTKILNPSQKRSFTSFFFFFCYNNVTIRVLFRLERLSRADEVQHVSPQGYNIFFPPSSSSSYKRAFQPPPQNKKKLPGATGSPPHSFTRFKVGGGCIETWLLWCPPGIFFGEMVERFSSFSLPTHTRKICWILF